MSIQTLVRFDAGTGVWSRAIEGGITEGGWTVISSGAAFPVAMAATDDEVWFALDRDHSDANLGAVIMLGRHGWTEYLSDLPVDDTVDNIAVAADGTVWYTVNGKVRRLER